MLDGQLAAVSAVSSALPQIERASEMMARALSGDGRLIYVAAGSSGLMALADAAEQAGTFGIAQDRVRLFMAGGVPVDAVMPGDTEDDTEDAAAIVATLTSSDVVIAVSASGTTPYPCKIARLARERGVGVIAIANNAGTELLGYADAAICLPTPPEVLAGSTRLGAGTAQKVALNMMSTLTGVRLGHVHDGMMVNVFADNKKLRARAQRIVAAIAGVDDAAASAALAAAGGRAKPAVLVALGLDPAAADALLARNDFHLRPSMAAVHSAKS
jgi:N-acetylmuramic acid 6-phosphate etherase